MKKILPVDITQLISELGMLIASGLSINKALEMVQYEQEKPAMHRLIVAFKSKADKGKSLADIWARYPQYFEPFLVEMLAQSDNKAVTLRHIAEYRDTIEQNEINLQQDLKFPRSYFMLLIITFVFISTIVFNYIIPVFNDTVSTYGTELPALTTFFISIAEFIGKEWSFILVSIFLIGGLLWWKWHIIKLYVPFWGRVYHQIALVRCLQTCTFMLSHHKSLPQALEAAEQISNNVMFAKLLKKSTQKIATGTGLSQALSPFFPKKVLHIITIGLPPNDMATLLTKLAHRYTLQFQKKSNLLMRVSSFMAFILLVGIIGTFIIAMYLPLFAMASIL
ncbi:MAG: type II secretion system F family protein [Thiomargarita sp.]|nr:type II secretion system F family protein [Thiomargarita sp.]